MDDIFTSYYNISFCAKAKPILDHNIQAFVTDVN